MKRKIRIKAPPAYANGGNIQRNQGSFEFDPYAGSGEDQPFASRHAARTLGPIDPNDANVIAERGETVLHDTDGDGQLEHFNIGGQRHEQGGTPLMLDRGDFIFSDRKKLGIRGDVLKNFGKTDTSKLYTPAALARQYDINYYKQILRDPESDKGMKQTAQRMIDNYTQKLGELATVQEALKNKPAPAFVQPDLSMADGGLVFAAAGTEIFQPEEPDVDKYKGGKKKTPTGRTNAYDRDDSYLSRWEGIIPGISKMSNKQAQGAIYDELMKSAGGRDQIRNMWGQYGLTARGLNNKSLKALTKNGVFNQGVLDSDKTLEDLKDAFVDGYFGARQLQYRDWRPMNGRQPFIPTFPDVSGSRNLKPNNNATPIPGLSLLPLHPGSINFSQPIQEPMSWWTQDKINFGAALANRYNIKKYMPWEPVVNPVLPNPTFLDPTRQLNANAEQANIQVMAGTLLGNAQSGRANGSHIQGQALANAGNILSQYDNQNVGIANQFAGGTAELINQAAMQNAAAKKRLYDGTVIANDQFDKEKKMATDVMRRQLTDGISNAQRTYWNNMLSEQYRIDPASGRLFFKQARPFSFDRDIGISANTASSNGLSMFQNLKRAYPDVNDSILWDHAKSMLGIGRNTQKDANGDGIVDEATYTGAGLSNLYNPFQ